MFVEASATTLPTILKKKKYNLQNGMKKQEWDWFDLNPDLSNLQSAKHPTPYERHNDDYYHPCNSGSGSYSSLIGGAVKLSHVRPKIHT